MPVPWRPAKNKTTEDLTDSIVECRLDEPRPFRAASPYIDMNEGALSTLPGLLRPYLEARSATMYGLWDDDRLPTEGGAADDARRVLLGRPEVSSVSGRIMLGKRKRDLGASNVELGLGLGVRASGIPGTTSTATAAKKSKNVAAAA